MANESTWIMSAPVISTGHITQAASEKLASLAMDNDYVVTMPGGWMVFVGEAYEDPNMPSEVMACMLWAKAQSYEWIRFDEGGDVVDNLPTYEW